VSGHIYGTPNPSSPGSVDDFGFAVYGDPYVTTDQQGQAIVANAHAPDYWDMFVLWPFNPFGNGGLNITGCGGQNYIGPREYDGANYFEYELDDQLVQNYYANKVSYPFICYHFGPLSIASTRFAIVGSFPDTLTLGAYIPFTTQYGMPLLDVYDETGNIVTTEYASSVSSNGTQATFPFPASLTQSGYSVAVENQIASSPGFVPAGTNYLSIAQSTTIAGNPFGVAAQDITTSWQSAYNPDPYGDGTCQGQWVFSSGTSTNSVPVVTQYSLNSVNNGGATIPTGPNPTAIALYNSQDNRDIEDDGPCQSYGSDTTQMTRAVVANSGGNTVSVLDIVNNVALSTITVGNQPVALAVSADGSTAYVANYTDGTVTQVNLTTGTVTATIAVGTQPTSIALTAAGTLWVGGVGFLSQLNANPMSVVATEAVTGKSIVALGFSDSVNQLVATTVDTSGNVYADEINPSTVRTGNAYSPLASNMVSSLGTYGTVRAYTATLAGAGRGNGGLLNTNQVGAPPLVVQDGWAVVTATPTGFTITDITGQVVLVSETTPSPVTAIALDSNLNAAYLLMPDSNTLLTVPLPGTNQAN
jgi:YVTN family beta-propeller protein